MRVVIDTNIIFSALLHREAREFNLIMWGDLDIYVCQFSTVELFKHKQRLLKSSGLTEDELLDNYYLVLKKLHVIREEDIQKEVWGRAEELCADVDPKDTVYVAASMMLDANLWSGDNKLRDGLISKGYDRLVTTAKLLAQ